MKLELLGKYKIKLSKRKMSETGNSRELQISDLKRRNLLVIRSTDHYTLNNDDAIHNNTVPDTLKRSKKCNRLMLNNSEQKNSIYQEQNIMEHRKTFTKYYQDKMDSTLEISKQFALNTNSICKTTEMSDPVEVYDNMELIRNDEVISVNPSTPDYRNSNLPCTDRLVFNAIRTSSISKEYQNIIEENLEKNNTVTFAGTYSCNIVERCSIINYITIDSCSELKSRLEESRNNQYLYIPQQQQNVQKISSVTNKFQLSSNSNVLNIDSSSSCSDLKYLKTNSAEIECQALQRDLTSSSVNCSNSNVIQIGRSLNHINEDQIGEENDGFIADERTKNFPETYNSSNGVQLDCSVNNESEILKTCTSCAKSNPNTEQSTMNELEMNAVEKELQPDNKNVKFSKTCISFEIKFDSDSKLKRTKRISNKLKTAFRNNDKNECDCSVLASPVQTQTNSGNFKGRSLKSDSPFTEKSANICKITSTSKVVEDDMNKALVRKIDRRALKGSRQTSGDFSAISRVNDRSSSDVEPIKKVYDSIGPKNNNSIGSLTAKVTNKRWKDAVSHVSETPNSNILKLYKQPVAQSNREIILKAAEYCVFPDVINCKARHLFFQKVAESKAKHFAIFFRNESLQFRALYTYDPETEKVSKLYGTGPNQVNENMFNKFYKFNTGTKMFSEVFTKHISVTIDAFTIHNCIWLGKKSSLPNKMNLEIIL